MAEIPLNGPLSGHMRVDASPQANSTVKSAGALANLAGAVVSVGLIVGIGVWGYRLLARDVSGVPVVRAAQGPMRVLPVDPGGSQADNQGLSVNSVAAEGMAAPAADRLVLAPQPAQLGDSDKPLPVLAAQSAANTATDAENGDVPAPVTLQMASIQALAEQLVSGAATLGEQSENTYIAPADVPAPTQVAAVAAPALVKSAPQAEILGGLGRSLRPQLRPASLSTDNVVPLAAVTPVSTTEIDADTIPVGSHLAQLGAFDSVETAKSEWDRLNTRFATYLDGKSRVIQRAESGGRTFFRLRAMGFEDTAATRRFCSALVAESADCITVVTR